MIADEIDYQSDTWRDIDSDSSDDDEPSTSASAIKKQLDKERHIESNSKGSLTLLLYIALYLAFLAYAVSSSSLQLPISSHLTSTISSSVGAFKDSVDSVKNQALQYWNVIVYHISNVEVDQRYRKLGFSLLKPKQKQTAASGSRRFGDGNRQQVDKSEQRDDVAIQVATGSTNQFGVDIYSRRGYRIVSEVQDMYGDSCTFEKSSIQIESDKDLVTGIMSCRKESNHGWIFHSIVMPNDIQSDPSGMARFIFSDHGGTVALDEAFIPSKSEIIHVKCNFIDSSGSGTRFQSQDFRLNWPRLLSLAAADGVNCDNFEWNGAQRAVTACESELSNTQVDSEVMKTVIDGLKSVVLSMHNKCSVGDEGTAALRQHDSLESATSSPKCGETNSCERVAADEGDGDRKKTSHVNDALEKPHQEDQMLSGEEESREAEAMPERYTDGSIGSDDSIDHVQKPSENNNLGEPPKRSMAAFRSQHRFVLKDRSHISRQASLLLNEKYSDELKAMNDSTNDSSEVLNQDDT